MAQVGRVLALLVGVVMVAGGGGCFLFDSGSLLVLLFRGDSGGLGLSVWPVFAVAGLVAWGVASSGWALVRYARRAPDNDDGAIGGDRP
jgi:hypothetical protein